MLVCSPVKSGRLHGWMVMGPVGFSHGRSIILFWRPLNMNTCHSSGEYVYILTGRQKREGWLPGESEVSPQVMKVSYVHLPCSLPILLVIFMLSFTQKRWCVIQLFIVRHHSSRCLKPVFNPVFYLVVCLKCLVCLLNHPL